MATVQQSTTRGRQLLESTNLPICQSPPGEAPDVTAKRLIDAVRSRNVGEVQSILNTRSELARMSHANLQVLHYAVLENAPDIVRLLMARGANARDGVYPHREATTALAIAVARGYDAIVRMIEEEEQKRRDARSGMRDRRRRRPLSCDPRQRR